MENFALIVCSGQWNVRIFTPNWVYKNVYCITSNKPMDVKLQYNSAAVQYKYDDIDFSVSDSKLELKCNELDEKKLYKIDSIFKHVTELLNHTPIFAVGYNIVSKLSKEELIKNPYFEKLLDEDKLGEYSLSSKTFLKTDDNLKSSIILSSDGKDGSIICNYEFSALDKLPENGKSFYMIKKDYKDIFNYEL